MSWDEIQKVLVSGLPTVLVAILGLVGILITQARADWRQERIAASGRQFQRDGDLLDKRRIAGAEFLVAVRALSLYSRSVLPDRSDASDLTPVERADLDRTYSQVLMVCDPVSRAAATELVRTLYDWIESFSDADWEALDKLEDRFVEAVNGETPPSSETQPSRRSIPRFGGGRDGAPPSGQTGVEPR